MVFFLPLVCVKRYKFVNIKICFHFNNAILRLSSDLLKKLTDHHFGGLSTYLGPGAHFRIRGSISGRTVYLLSIDMTGFFKIHSRNATTLLRRGGAIFCVFADFRFYTNAIYLHQVYQFPRRLLPRSYRLPPD